jgi:hypothetical protein
MNSPSHLRRLVAAALLCLILIAIPSHASYRAPGKYSGVVIFDRWDTCFLLSGHYITYISEKVKEPLRAYKDIAMQIDAKEIFQPMNPGDALITKYDILGKAPEVNDGFTPKLDGLSLRIRPDFDSDGSVSAFVDISNAGKSGVQVLNREFGPTLLGANVLPESASDGKSVAWLTRTGFFNDWPDFPGSQGSERRWQVGELRYFVCFSYNPKTTEPTFELAPNKTKTFRVTFEASPGDYQFLVGYGGGVHAGRSIASAPFSLHIDDRRRAHLLN